MWLIYKARPVNNCLAFSDTKEFILMGPSGQVLTACLAIVLLTGPLHERAGSNTANPFQRYLDLAKREAEKADWLLQSHPIPLGHGCEQRKRATKRVEMCLPGVRASLHPAHASPDLV